MCCASILLLGLENEAFHCNFSRRLKVKEKVCFHLQGSAYKWLNILKVTPLSLISNQVSLIRKMMGNTCCDITDWDMARSSNHFLPHVTQCGNHPYLAMLAAPGPLKYLRVVISY